MMRSSSSKVQGKVEAVNSESPLENGLPPKQEEDEMGRNVREVAAKVVENVIKMASEAAQEKSPDHPSTTKSKGCGLPRLPTIQIDTVASAPSSPVDWSPIEESNEVEEPVDESDIQLELDTGEQETDICEENLKEFLKSYVEDLLSQAMVLAEKKLQFTLPEEDEEEDEEQAEPEPIRSSPELAQEPEKEIDDSEIRAAAEKVVEEVIAKATEVVTERLENSVAELSFPITFDEAPEEVKEAATAFVKEIIGKAVAMAEEKSPTVPFSFEDVDTMKSSGPWYIRAREAFIRFLRTACFCTPRRTDS